MDLTAITFTELRYLVAIAETGHFGRAAEACHVSQPTLSMQLRKLEDTLGVPLLERGTRQTCLTLAGARVVERARAILSEVRAIGEVARGHTAPLEGELRLGVIPTLGPYLLPDLLVPLQQAYPRLRLLVAENLTLFLIEELSAHRLDAALLALPTSAPGLQALPLFAEPFWFLAPKGHRLARRKTLREDDLKQEKILLLAEGHCFREQALAICGEIGPASGDDFAATSLETLRHLVGAGLGSTLLPALAVPRLASRETIVRPFSTPAPQRNIGLVWRRSFARPEAMQLLGEFIRRTATAALLGRGGLPDPSTS